MSRRQSYYRCPICKQEREAERLDLPKGCVTKVTPCFKCGDQLDEWPESVYLDKYGVPMNIKLGIDE